MESSNCIKHEIGHIENDVGVFDRYSVKSDILEPHPLESAYQSARKREDDIKRKILANTFGSAFPLKMELDNQILCRFQRPPGPIPSSMLGLEAMTGGLDNFGVEDYLDDPCESENRPLDMHHGMEVRLGISKGPIYQMRI